MDGNKDVDKILLPHHEQLDLCTTRLPYRQGRKLTAVKVYTVNDESNHLLIFGVPSLDLRQQLKSHFTRFGKLTKFGISQDHYSETFTDTYHAVYDNIQAARLAKKFLDTKNFYGGLLHVCYAPEFETIDETKAKLDQRKRGVLARLRNLSKEKTELIAEIKESPSELNVKDINNTKQPVKLDMGNINTIAIGKQIRDVFKKPAKRKAKPVVAIEKKFKASDKNTVIKDNTPCEIVDCTSVDLETVSNIDMDKILNYNNFGNEIVKKVPPKPVNKIVLYITNKKL